jgi:hypothetical protein
LDSGTGYIGGDVYFASNSPYLVDVPLDEVSRLKTTSDAPVFRPEGLKRAVCTFLVGASSRLASGSEAAYSLLVHVSLKTKDHNLLRSLIQDYVDKLSIALRLGGASKDDAQRRKELEEAYTELGKTAASSLSPLDKVLEVMSELIASADVQVLNSTSDEKQARYDSPFNILIGGTKLGRGVTIQGLLVTYYGRESKNPQMDTVQQHARMYGYRSHDLPLSRIFLPPELAAYFRGLTLSENELREWLGSLSELKIHPLVVPNGMKATRSNVLNPNTIGYYTPGRSYSPSPALFQRFTDYRRTELLDGLLGLPRRGNPLRRYLPIDDIIEILELIKTGANGAGRWEDQRIAGAFRVLKDLYDNKGCLAVFGDRNLSLTEKANVADSDDLQEADRLLPTLLMFRQNGKQELGWSGVPFWIPVVRFPDDQHPIGFNFSQGRSLE